MRGQECDRTSLTLVDQAWPFQGSVSKSRAGKLLESRMECQSNSFDTDSSLAIRRMASPSSLSQLT